MSIIREIKAAWRWLFNIKDEVSKYDIYRNDIFSSRLNGLRVHVINVNGDTVFYRYRSCVRTYRLSKEIFDSQFRKTSS